MIWTISTKQLVALLVLAVLALAGAVAVVGVLLVEPGLAAPAVTSTLLSGQLESDSTAPADRAKAQAAGDPVQLPPPPVAASIRVTPAGGATTLLTVTVH